MLICTLLGDTICLCCFYWNHLLVLRLLLLELFSLVDQTHIVHSCAHMLLFKLETRKRKKEKMTPEKKINVISVRKNNISLPWIHNWQFCSIFKARKREDLENLSYDITTWVFWQQSKEGMRKEQRSEEIFQLCPRPHSVLLWPACS